MAKYRFKNVGMRMLESEAGDVIICDSNLGFDTIIVAEIIDRAKLDDRLAAMLGRQFVNFVVKQKEARIKIADQKLNIIAKLDQFKARLLSSYLAEGNLHKVEKDIYFFFQDHPEIDDSVDVEMLPKHDIQNKPIAKGSDDRPLEVCESARP